LVLNMVLLTHRSKLLLKHLHKARKVGGVSKVRIAI
jgi:hypothetical protein